MTEKMENIDNVYPSSGGTEGNGSQQVPQNEVAVSAANQLLIEKQKTALYQGIGSIVCLMIGWFVFGLFFGFFAAGLGWSAVKDGNIGTKILGLGGLAGGAFYIMLSFGLMFYY
jgi:hypothetical protein